MLNARLILLPVSTPPYPSAWETIARKRVQATFTAAILQRTHAQRRKRRMLPGRREKAVRCPPGHARVAPDGRRWIVLGTNLPWSSPAARTDLRAYWQSVVSERYVGRELSSVSSLAIHNFGLPSSKPGCEPFGH